MNPFLFREMYYINPSVCHIYSTEIFLRNLREYWKLRPVLESDTIDDVCRDFMFSSGTMIIEAIRFDKIDAFNLFMRYGVSISPANCLRSAARHCRPIMLCIIIKKYRITKSQYRKALVDLMLSNTDSTENTKIAICKILLAQISKGLGCITRIIIDSDKRNADKNDPVYRHLSNLRNTLLKNHYIKNPQTRHGVGIRKVIHGGIRK